MSIKLPAIPPEAVAAAEAEILGGIARNFTSEEIARLACRAMLEAWPDLLLERRAACSAIVLPFDRDAINPDRPRRDDIEDKSEGAKL